MPEMIEIKDSLTVKAAGYDSAESRFYVEFRTGEIRAYLDVPQEVADKFYASPTKAAFIVRRIIGRYEYTQLNGQAE